MDAHDDHGSHRTHPAAAAVVVLVIAAIYGVIFKLSDGGWTNAVILATVLMAAWGISQVVLSDRD